MVRITSGDPDNLRIGSRGGRGLDSHDKPSQRPRRHIAHALTRAHAITAHLESGNVYLPDESIAEGVWFTYSYIEVPGESSVGKLVPVRTGLEDFLSEHDMFPNGAHDDQVDATTQALQRMTRGEPNMLGYLRSLVEEQKRQTDRPVSPTVTYGYGPNWQPPDPAKPNW